MIYPLIQTSRWSQVKQQPERVASALTVCGPELRWVMRRSLKNAWSVGTSNVMRARRRCAPGDAPLVELSDMPMDEPLDNLMPSPRTSSTWSGALVIRPGRMEA